MSDKMYKEQIQQLRKKYPNLRPLKQMTDKQLMFMLNHVAMNNVNTDRHLMAKKGNKLISKHQTGKNIFHGANGPIFDEHTKKWYNTKGEEIPQNHKYKKDFGYTIYTKDGYAIDYDNDGREIYRRTGTTVFGLYRKKENNLYDQQNKKSYSQSIPFIKDKQITLTNAGKLTGAKLSTNMLDSLAKYGAIVGLPVQSAIGLAGQESTFGTLRSEIAPNDSNPRHLVNDHAYYEDNPYNDLIWTAMRKAYKIDPNYTNKYYQARDSIVKAGISYAEKQIPKWRERMNIPVLQHAFTKYKQGTYNIGDPNHTRDVEEAGKAAFGSPEIQHWWNTEGYKWYK